MHVLEKPRWCSVTNKTLYNTHTTKQQLTNTSFGNNKKHLADFPSESRANSACPSTATDISACLDTTARSVNTRFHELILTQIFVKPDLNGLKAAPPLKVDLRARNFPLVLPSEEQVTRGNRARGKGCSLGVGSAGILKRNGPNNPGQNYLRKCFH